MQEKPTGRCWNIKRKWTGVTCLQILAFLECINIMGIKESPEQMEEPVFGMDLNGLEQEFSRQLREQK